MAIHQIDKNLAKVSHCNNIIMFPFQAENLAISSHSIINDGIDHSDLGSLDFNDKDSIDSTQEQEVYIIDV